MGDQEDGAGEVAERADSGDLADGDEDLPVVARIIVEIRSDGTRTVARGALDDRASGQRVALQFDAGTPLSLAKSLAKAILGAPALAAAGWRSRLRRKALRKHEE